MTRTAKIVTISLIGVVLFCSVGALCLFDPTKKVVFTSTQVGSVKYDDVDPYYLWVSQGWDRDFEFFVSNDGGYGYGASCSIPGDNVHVTAANWLPEGLEIVFSQGHKYFIPKECFIGGR